ncbi:phosphatase PAP2 family protein [Streptomyces sp. ISL-96]|uniref:phosphatase PAP2 family protein n=1 Tax=Streptomyces sp. ISL-96 TaxID=2819191 RepID=UPI001BEAA40B|nr:phosphatase PAP2 family protein [Streptomyces sp. ISL-96]MBT2488122.1 phosphatase PAP2 family protein [Streptomyces sp. ISL-96]
MQDTAPRPRPRWWTELLLLVAVYAAYSGGRLLVRGGEATAVEHGLAILRVEKLLYLNAEHPLNRLFTAHSWLGIPADFAYASLHYVVTPAILVWLFRRRTVRYRAARTWLMLSTFLGLIGFTLMPTCPPRLLEAGHGFVDTMAQYSAYGWWGAQASAPRGLGGFTNQYAAMPSLHVGWALWCGVMLWRHGRTPLMKSLGVAYPLLTTFVVMGTANHYFLDAVAGAAVMGAGLALTRPFMRLANRVRDRFAPQSRGVESIVARGVVSAGCETSEGERIPGQRTRTSTPAGASAGEGGSTGESANAGAGDGTPAAAR